jgi:hypothetical protein
MGWDRRIAEQDILRMEDYLSTLMHPVRPRDEFVQELRQGLGQEKTGSSEEGDFGFLERIFWVIAGFTSAIVLLTVGIRVIINLVRGSSLKGRGRGKGIASLQ